jgi:hypothetical protein
MLIKVITWFSVYSGLNAIADALSAPFTSNGRQYFEVVAFFETWV